jgi:hypothetical protein
MGQRPALEQQEVTTDYRRWDIQSLHRGGWRDAPPPAANSPKTYPEIDP